MRPTDDKLFEKVSPDRRNFLKRIFVSTAFAVPIIQSFDMNDLKTSAALAQGTGGTGFTGSE